MDEFQAPCRYIYKETLISISKLCYSRIQVAKKELSSLSLVLLILYANHNLLKRKLKSRLVFTASALDVISSYLENPKSIIFSNDNLQSMWCYVAQSSILGPLSFDLCLRVPFDLRKTNSAFKLRRKSSSIIISRSIIFSYRKIHTTCKLIITFSLDHVSFVVKWSYS